MSPFSRLPGSLHGGKDGIPCARSDACSTFGAVTSQLSGPLSRDLRMNLMRYHPKRDTPKTSEQKNKSDVRNISAHNSWTGNGCGNFMGTWDFLVPSAGKPSMPIIERGGYFGFLLEVGGVPILWRRLNGSQVGNIC